MALVVVEEKERKDAFLQTIADDYSRKILFSLVERSKPIEEIARETGVPVSTCYRKMRELISLRLIRVERIVITETGKKFETYRSIVKNAIFRLSPSGDISLEVDLVTREPDERLSRMWSATRMKN